MKDGLETPKYDARLVRDSINKLLGKIAVERVHTSPNKNIVLTCQDSSPEELLEKKDLWIGITKEWSVEDIQKINNWPKLVIHGVPTMISMANFKKELAEFNPLITLEGEPRWLTKPSNKIHSSVVISVNNDKQKSVIRKKGLLISGLLLKAVNYQSATAKTQCRKCLKFGHQVPFCNKPATCGFCADGHLTTNHSCGICRSSTPCAHVSKKCANCKSNTHTAFERQHCEFFKALSC